jgi:hypothetical protein
MALTQAGFSKLGPESDPPVYPDYIEAMHRQWLDGSTSTEYPDEYAYNMRAYLEAALQQADTEGRFGPAGPGSPYYNAVVYDPAEQLASMEARLDLYLTRVDELDPNADFDNLVDTVAAKKGVVVADATAIDDAVDAFADKELDAFNADLNSLCGAMFEARATQNSQFIMGIFQGHARMQARVAEHRSNLEAQSKRLETMWIMQATQELNRLVQNRLDQLRIAAAMRQDLGKMDIVAKTEFHENELRMEVEDAFYELELFKYGNNALAAPQGLATNPPRLPKGQAALAGLLSAAPAAVTLGGATGSVGAGVLFAALSMGLNWAQGY